MADNALAQKIKQATLDSVKNRDLYSAQTVSTVTQNLKSCQEDIAKSILKYKISGSLSENKLAALNGLEKLNGEIADILKDLKKNQTMIFKGMAKDGFVQGIYSGIKEFTDAQMPFYKDLKSGEINKLSTSVFTLVDTDALDFMTNYNVTLAGDVHRDITSGINRVVMNGITQGKSAEDMVRDMGAVVVDKESFRQAGTRVFSSAQYRMEMIARTETLRAHNQGRLKFHQRVGVQKLEWVAMADERMCPVCGTYDGKEFAADKFPPQPAHPHCRCTHVAAWPITVCGGEL